jgi:PAS domain S-box-containing protein
MLDRRGLRWAGLVVGCVAVAAVTAWWRDAISALLVSALLAALLVSLAQHRAGRAHGQRLRMLVDNSSDAIIMQSIHGVISGWNPAAERIFGYARGEAIGHRLALFADAADYVTTITNAMATLSRGDASQAFDSVCLREDGARFDVSIAASAITNAHGVITGIALTIRDTSAARAAERSLRELTGELEQQVSERTAMHAEAHRDLETILDALPSMIGYWDHNLINRFANRAYRDWYRNAHDPLVGCCLRDLLDGTIYLRHREEIDGALAGETQRFELEVAVPNGHGSRHLFVHYLPNRINGKVEGFYALIHDISEVKAAQRQVANSEEFLSRAEQVSGVGGWEVRLDTGRVTWTEQTRRIHEVADDFVPDMTNVLTFYPRDGRIALDEAFDEVLSTGHGWDLELPFATALGRTRWVRMVGEVEKTRGKPVRMIGAIQDITDQRRAAEALRQAILAAEAASAAKSSFLANMSHEIRTPLNAVIGLSYLLEQSQLDAEQRSFVAKIQVASRSLLGVINDVLDLSKIEAGEMVLEDAAFDLRALVHEIAQLMAPQAEAKQLGLRVALPTDLPAVIHGDVTRVRQI